VGFLRAPIAFEVVRSRILRLSLFDADAVNAMFDAMAAEAEAVVRLGAPGAAIRQVRSADMRYLGQGHEILVSLPAGRFTNADIAALRERFESQYRVLFGRSIPGQDIEVTGWTLLAEAERTGDATLRARTIDAATVPASPIGKRALFDPAASDFREVPVYHRLALAAGQLVSGPAVIVEDETTTIVTASFTASIDPSGAIRLTARAKG
jgi:N-methylhydantoinase A